MKSVLDPDFKYTPSFATNIRERFEKVKDGQSLFQPTSAHHVVMEVDKVEQIQSSLRTDRR